MSDPYVYSDHPDTLVNIQGVKETWRAQQMIREAAEARAYELSATPALATGRFDLDHLKRIHKHLFQDTLKWAGEIRTITVDVERDRGLTKARPDRIVERSATIHRALTEEKFIHATLTPAQNAQTVARHWQRVHNIGAFRAGNFPAQRIMFEQFLARRDLQMKLDQRLVNDLRLSLEIGRPIVAERVLMEVLEPNKQMIQARALAEGHSVAKVHELDKFLGLAQTQEQVMAVYQQFGLPTAAQTRSAGIGQIPEPMAQSTRAALEQHQALAPPMRPPVQSQKGQDIGRGIRP